LTDFTDQAASHYRYQRQAIPDGTSLTTFSNGAGDSTSYKDLIDRSGYLHATVTDPAGDLSQTSSDAAGLHTSRTLACGVTEATTYGLDPLAGHKFVSERSRGPGSGHDNQLIYFNNTTSRIL
jgi:hypothetical protein